MVVDGEGEEDKEALRKRRGGEGGGVAGDTEKSWYLDDRGGKEF